MSKHSLSEIVSDHFRTLYDATTGKPSPWDIASQTALPVLAGIACGVGWLPLHHPGDVLAGVAVTTALLFAFLAGLLPITWAEAQRAEDVGADPEMHKRKRWLRELTANAAYAALVAVLDTLVLIAAAATASDQGIPPRGLQVAGWVLLAHMTLVMAMVLKRTYLLIRHSVTRIGTSGPPKEQQHN